MTIGKEKEIEVDNFFRIKLQKIWLSLTCESYSNESQHVQNLNITFMARVVIGHVSLLVSFSFIL